MKRDGAGPWRHATVRYSAVLRAEMARNGITPKQLAARLAVTPSAVGYYLQARYLPRPEIASAIAEILCSEPLSKMTTIGAVIRCSRCGRERFRGQTRRRFCSDLCRSRAWAEGGPPPTTGIQAAVDLFCAACEPERVCRDASCVLQPFSPLPLARRRFA